MRIVFVLLMIWANTAFGQTYPDYQSTTVNDFANLLSPLDEEALAEQLDELKRETGVEMTILTLRTQGDYADGLTLEQFATGLFDHWGIGDASRNDGVLVMVLRDDRAMRIELGAAYGRDWDHAAERIVDTQFLPAFKANNYAIGIKAGTTAIIDQIIQPFRTGEAAPAKKTNDDLGLWIFGLFAMMIMMLKGRNFISDGLVRLRTCPKCGNRSLRQRRRITLSASTTRAGSGIRRIECLKCDYAEETSYYIPQVSQSSGGGGFGGGRSGGGGASGRW